MFLRINESKEVLENIDFDKEVWEGWTIQDFIDELEPILDMIQNGDSWQKPITTKQELKKWIVDNQPYYKKAIPDVINYFANKYGIR